MYSVMHSTTTAAVLKSNEASIRNFIDATRNIMQNNVNKLLDISQTTSNRSLRHIVGNGLIYQEGSKRKTNHKKRGKTSISNSYTNGEFLLILVFLKVHTTLHMHICILHLLIHQEKYHHEQDSNGACTV